MDLEVKILLSTMVPGELQTLVPTHLGEGVRGGRIQAARVLVLGILK